MHMVNVDGAATTTSFPATNTQSIPICSLEHSVMHPVHSRADLGALTASSQHLLNFSNAQQPPHKVATRNYVLIFSSRRNSNTCNFLPPVRLLPRFASECIHPCAASNLSFGRFSSSTPPTCTLSTILSCFCTKTGSRCTFCISL